MTLEIQVSDNNVYIVKLKEHSQFIINEKALYITVDDVVKVSVYSGPIAGLDISGYDWLFTQYEPDCLGVAKIDCEAVVAYDYEPSV